MRGGGESGGAKRSTGVRSICQGRVLVSGEAIDVTKLGSTPVGPTIEETSASSGSSALRREHPAEGDDGLPIE
jgi:hypothetical protein